MIADIKVRHTSFAWFVIVLLVSWAVPKIQFLEQPLFLSLFYIIDPGPPFPLENKTIFTDPAPAGIVILLKNTQSLFLQCPQISLIFTD
jgi:hypothetical protein